MTKIQPVRRCFHCGAILQKDDEALPGYVDSEILESHSPSEVLLCQKCFAKQRFNRFPKSASISDDYVKMLEDARASDSLIVHVIDLTSFECSFDAETAKICKSLPRIVIANKRDLIPAAYKDENLKDYVAYIFKENGLPVEKEDIYVTNLLSSGECLDIVAAVEKKRKGHDVYIVGALNSGKSLFLDSFLRSYKNRSNRSVGSSLYYGTKIEVLKIPLDSSSSIFDTPGKDDDNSFFACKDGNVLKALVTEKPYTAKKHILIKGASLFISNLARIDYLSGNGISLPLSVHIPDKIQCKTVLPKKNMDALFLKLLEKKAMKPHPSFIKGLSDYDVFDVSTEPSEGEHQEISIAGLGWVSFRIKDSLKIRIYVPKGIGVFIGKAKGTKIC